MRRRPPRSTRTHTLSLHDALPICDGTGGDAARLAGLLALVRRSGDCLSWKRRGVPRLPVWMPLSALALGIPHWRPSTQLGAFAGPIRFHIEIGRAHV